MEFTLIPFKTKSGGTPTGADQLPLQEEKLDRKHYSNAEASYAYAWEASIMCRRVECVIPSDDTFNGRMVWERYELPDGRRFDWGYGKGSPYNFDYGVFRLVEE